MVLFYRNITWRERKKIIVDDTPLPGKDKNETVASQENCDNFIGNYMQRCKY
jgi:hypothetical protein